MKHTLIMSLAMMFNFLFAYSGDPSKITEEKARARSFYERHMESSHPSPEARKEEKFLLLLGAEEKYSKLFLNISASVDQSIEDGIQNESSIAVNPANPLNLIASAVDYRQKSSTWVYVSSDGGFNWVNLNLGKPNPNWTSSNDPSVAFDNDGTGYLVYGGFGNIRTDTVIWGENAVFFAKTTDGGKSWKAHTPVIIHQGEQTLDSTFEDKYYISVDNSPGSQFRHNLYIPWKRVTPRDSATQIVIARSTDKGESWSAPVPVSQRLSGSSEDTTFGQSFPICTVGPSGEVYLVWNHGIEHGIGYSKSIDGGVSFSQPKIIHHYNIFGETKKMAEGFYRHVVKGKVRAEAYPSIACDVSGGPGNGYVYLCWAADRVPNVYFSRSTDGGNNWSQPVIVHSDTANDQFWPWLAVDPTSGDIAVMYFDSRNDPKNLMVETYVSLSNDGGLTWIDRPAADVSNDLRLNPFANNAFAGDYSGCAFYNGIIYPSWVDMRNSVAYISDNDVYTAWVNIKLPNPPENFTVKPKSESPDKLFLTWKAPTERVFGQPMPKSEFKFSLYRNNSFLTYLASDIESFEDSNLTPFEKYDYKILTVATGDSSSPRLASAYAGGARKPSPPVIVASSGETGLVVNLRVAVPSFRVDGITPLAFPEKIGLFRDSILIKEIPISISDTGSTIWINDKVDREGFYVFSLKLTENYHKPEINPEESDYSNRVIVFTGDFRTSYSEFFDQADLPKYYLSGSWGKSSQFSYSPPNSFTESPDGKYPNSSRDTLILFPVRATAQGKLYLDFRHMALVQDRDSAIVDYSLDNMQTWLNLASFNIDDYPAWGDGILNSDDWKPEKLAISGDPYDTVYIRFRFRADAFKSDDGWYIDNIEINSPSGVGEIEKIVHQQEIYPNPAIDFICINNWGNPAPVALKLLSVLGTDMTQYLNLIEGKTGTSCYKISNLPAGIYYIIVELQDGRKFNTRFIKL